MPETQVNDFYKHTTSGTHGAFLNFLLFSFIGVFLILFSCCTFALIWNLYGTPRFTEMAYILALYLPSLALVLFALNSVTRTDKQAYFQSLFLFVFSGIAFFWCVEWAVTLFGLESIFIAFFIIPICLYIPYYMVSKESLDRYTFVKFIFYNMMLVILMLAAVIFLEKYFSASIFDGAFQIAIFVIFSLLLLKIKRPIEGKQ